MFKKFEFRKKMSATGLLPKSQLIDPFAAGISSGTNTIFDAYLGQPRGGTTNPMEKRNVTTWDMPEAYEGKSLFLGNTIMDWMWTANQTFYTEVVMPYKVVDDIFVEWSTWEANAHILGLTPEEATSRLISQRRNVRRAALVRRGISMQFEHGWIKTLLGRQSFLIGLGQIARSFQETANAEVIRALLHAHHYQQQYVRENGQVKRLDFLDYLREQRDYFAYFQKTQNGAAMWDQKTDTEMYTYHGMADTIMVPDKMMTYITFRPENVNYYLAGPRGPDRVDDIPGKNSEITPVHLADRLEPQRWMNNKRVYQVRAFHVDGVQPVDLLSKPMQIGEYYTMTDEYCVYDEKYSSTERAIMIFDEDRNRFAKVDLNMALDNSQLFNGNGVLNTPPEPSTQSDEASTRDRLMDVFINKRTGESVQFFGEIDPNYQPQELLEKIGVVAAARAGSNDANYGKRLQDMFGGANNKFETTGDAQAVVAALKTGYKVAKRVVEAAEKPTKPIESDVKSAVTGFKDMVAASLRDDRDVQSQARRFFPDNRAPTAGELDALRDFGARNSAIQGDYASFFNPRRTQFEQVLKNAGATPKASPKTSTSSSNLLWVPVGEQLPEGYEWLQDEHGEEIFSGFHGVNSVADLPFIRAQRALKASVSQASIGDDVREVSQPRYQRQGLIGLMEGFDADGEEEGKMYGRKFVDEEGPTRRFEVNEKGKIIKFVPLLDEYVTLVSQLPLTEMQKAAVIFFLGAPCTRAQFRAFITYNLPFPGNFLLCRAHATYGARSAIKVLAGQIGNTYFAHMNAEIGQDASRMIGLLHVVAYMSAIVTTPQHVYVEPAPYVDQYYGGMNMVFWDPESYARRVARGNHQSILCFFVPYAEKNFPNPLDISGRFNTELDYGLFNLNNRYESLHYSTAYRYNELYQIYTRATAMDDMSVPTVIPEDVHVNRIW